MKKQNLFFFSTEYSYIQILLVRLDNHSSRFAGKIVSTITINWAKICLGHGKNVITWRGKPGDFLTSSSASIVVNKMPFQGGRRKPNPYECQLLKDK